VPGGVLGGVVGGLPTAPPPPPPPQQPIHTGGQIKDPVRVKNVDPVYPQIAKLSKTSGIVMIEATISTTGKVVDAKIIKSVPLLDEAALTAVRQWEYTPTLLNNMPVPIIMTITVIFTLK
jgi:protein TonB